MMESKLLSMMKSKFEYRLYINWWKPEFMNLKKKGKKRGMAKVNEKEPWCPIVTFPFP